MKKWYRLYDTAKFPLKILCFALALMGFGFLIQNKNVNIFYTFRNTYLILLAETAYKIGETLLRFVPLFFLGNVVAKKANSGAPMLMAFVGYVAYETTMMIFSTGNYASEAYARNLAISYDATAFPVDTAGIRYPLNTGLIGIFIIAFFTRYAYIKSRNRSSYSILSFGSKNTAGLVYVTIGSALLGFIAALIYPFFYNFLEQVIQGIGKDLNDLFNIAAYGLLDRLLQMFFMGDLIRTPFWFGSLGGSYQTIVGQTILGDVNIWNYIQEASDSFMGCGRFITPYYVINIFMIPALCIGLFCSISDKKDKRRKIPLLILSIIFSILCGNPLPVELFLLFTAPLLLAMYLLMVMAIFAYCVHSNIYLGFSYSGTSTLFAFPGSFPDYIINLRDPYLFDTVINIALVGIVAAIIIFLLTIFYFRFLSYDLLQTGKKQRFLNIIYDSVGGLENISSSSASLLRININLNDLEKVDFEKIARVGARRMVETKNGISLDIGSGSLFLSRALNSAIRKAKR